MLHGIKIFYWTTERKKYCDRQILLTSSSMAVERTLGPGPL